MAVDAGIAAQLMAVASFIQQAGGDWPGALAELRRVSPFLSQSDAQAEALRVAALHGAPLVVDRVRVAGTRRDLLARSCTIRNPRLGYGAGMDCFVVSVEEGDSDTVLRVIRRL